MFGATLIETKVIGLWSGPFHCPDIHPLFYGTADNVFFDEPERHLYVDDYKHGAGIIVEADDNPQGKYYAIGVLTTLSLWDQVDKVTIGIVQPRGYHWSGPIRQWTTTVEELREWSQDVLIPAMETAEVSRETKSGPHCRFCPVRSHSCPALNDDMNELERLMNKATDEGGAKELTSAEVARFLELFDTAKIVAKAASKTAFDRMQAGKEVPGHKLVRTRANRVWKEDAAGVVEAVLGDKAFYRAEAEVTQSNRCATGRKGVDRTVGIQTRSWLNYRISEGWPQGSEH